MKNSLLALALSLSSASAFAQIAEISDLNPRTFKGIQVNVNRDIFYAAYPLRDNADSIVTKIWNRELMEIGTFGLSIPKNAQLASYTYTNEFLILLFNDVAKKSRTTYVMNLQGSVVAQDTEENVKASLLESANAPLMFSSNPREFVIVQKGQNGYTLEGKDVELKTKWTKSFNPENGAWEVIQMLPAMDRLYLLRKESAADGKYAFSIQAVSLNEGNVVFTAPLGMSGGGYPMSMQVNEDMTISASGVYFKNNKITDKAEGIFFSSFDGNGRKIQFSEMPWGAIKAQMPTSNEQALIDGSTNVLIQAGVPTFDRMGHILIAETYDVNRNSKDQNASFKVGDLVTYQLDRDGKVVAVNRIEKSPRKLVVKTNATNDFDLADQMYQNGYFAFRNVAGQLNKQYVVYKEEGGNSVAGLSFHSLSDTAKNNIVNGDSDNRPKTPKIIDLNVKDDSNMERYQNVISLREGKILSYHYEDNRLMLRIQPAGVY